MKKTNFFCIVLMFIMVILFVGCSKTDEEKIIGTWVVIKEDGKETDEEKSMTFSQNGTVTLLTDDSTEQAQYELVDNRIIYTVGQYFTTTYTCDYQIQGNILMLYDFGGMDFEMKKK